MNEELIQYSKFRLESRMCLGLCSNTMYLPIFPSKQLTNMELSHQCHFLMRLHIERTKQQERIPDHYNEGIQVSSQLYESHAS